MDFLSIELTAMALLLVRSVLGVLFVFQAYDKLFGLGILEVARSMESNNALRKLPHGFVKFSVAASSTIELLGGILLILGFFLPAVYTILSINFILVVTGLSLASPMWEMKHVFPRMLMLIFLMMVPLSNDIYRIYTWLNLPSIFQ